MKKIITHAILLPLGWFLLVNTGVFLLASLSISLLSLDMTLASNGITMLEVCFIIALFGALGALAMLLASKPIIRLFLNARVADDTMGTKVQQLKLMVDKQARQADIRPPELAIYQAEEMNAFAVGSGRRHSVLVVSQRLLDSLTLDELSAVIGHEITHICNGDMVTLSLMQGVVNMCVHFPARLLGMGLDKLLFRDRPFAPVTRTIGLILQLSLGGIASLIVMWFSRHREFTADAGGARLAGHAEMMAALRSLQAGAKNEPVVHPFAVFGLNGNFITSGLMRLFSSHPSLSERMQALCKDR